MPVKLQMCGSEMLVLLDSFELCNKDFLFTLFS